ncbi:hypothetical protein FIBSPDRAFT_287473 [Athelia psychrophila]|uniref:Uncharacterized protein n=1 Tax=Athelia psychrophila TaxID=1759441 RepID=A0A167XNI0_9AGAM|nr:hypothetical protein FIBSPDRAFT_287473 [Fibularhizoctonia sp. CBS 109695]
MDLRRKDMIHFRWSLHRHPQHPTARFALLVCTMPTRTKGHHPCVELALSPSDLPLFYHFLRRWIYLPGRRLPQQTHILCLQCRTGSWRKPARGWQLQHYPHYSTFFVPHIVGGKGVLALARQSGTIGRRTPSSSVVNAPTSLSAPIAGIEHATR